MKKQLKSYRKITALIISIAVFLSCVSAGVFSLAEAAGNDTDDFLMSNAEYSEVDKGWYDITYKNTWGYAITAKPIDLTKGVYFYTDNFIDSGDWLMFIFRDEFSVDATPYDSTIKIRHSNGRLEGTKHVSSVSWDVGFTNFGSGNKTHFLQAVPVQSEGEILSYQLYINGITFSGAGGFSISVEDFKKYNNYNETTGNFDGTYLCAAVINAPRFGLAVATEDGFTGSLSNFEYTKNPSGNDNITLGEGGRANSVWQADLRNGVSFTLDGLSENDQEDFATISFANDLWSLRKNNATNSIKPSFRLKNVDGKLAVATFDGTSYGDYQQLGSDVVSEHVINAEEVTVSGETSYKFYIDGQLISGYSFNKTEFNELNNYLDGAYIGFSANKGVKIGDIYKSKALDKPFVGADFTCEQNNEPYTVNIAPWGYATSTWRVDLTTGITFNLSELPANGDWVSIGLYGDFWNMPKGPVGVDLKNHYTIFLRNEDGKIRASLSVPGEFAFTSMDLSITETHVLSLKPFTSGEEKRYRFDIDGLALVGNLSISAEEFNALNNYDKTLEAFKGSYVRFGSCRGISVSNIARALPAEEPFIETYNFSSVNDNGSYQMKIGSWGSAVSLWQSDLTKGIFFNLDDLTNDDGNDWAQILFVPDIKKPTQTFGVAVMLKQKDGQLYASATNGMGEWCMTYFGLATGTHLLKAVPVDHGSGEIYYHLTIDGKDFNGIFAFTEEDFNKINNYNEDDSSFSGVHYMFHASSGVKMSILVPGDISFIGEKYADSKNENGKFNIELSDNGYAVSTWQVDLTAGLAFEVEKFNSDVSIRFANNLWTMSKKETVVPENCQPIIKLRDDNGKLSVSVSDDPHTDSFSVMKEISAAGEHTLMAKKVYIEALGRDVYRFYIDKTEIGSSYYLEAEEFDKINNYDTVADTFSGATMRFAAEKAVKINNIYKAVEFEGAGFSYKAVSEGHYNLNIDPWSYAVAKWKTDLVAGLSFNVEKVNGWIMLRFANSFEKMYVGMPGDKVNTYQPVMLMKNDPNGLYVAMLSGEMHKGATMLKGMKLEGTHRLTVRLAPDSRTGVMYYRFYLDGMPIVQDYTMSVGVFKKINGYDETTDSFGGANIFFGSENGTVMKDIHSLVIGETVQKGTWDTNTDADIEKINDNVFNLNMKAFSSLRSSRAVNMEKGITFTLKNPVKGTSFGIALSMLPGGTLLDVPPIIANENGMYYMFSQNEDNTYSVVSSSGLSAIWNGDLAGTHTYSMVKITDRDGKEKYTLAIDGKAVFDGGMEKSDYIMFSNASKGSYPTIFTKTDMQLTNLTGEFINITIENNEGLWDEDWDAGIDDFEEWEDDEDSDWDYEEEDSFFDDEYEEEYEDITEEPETTTKRVLVKRVKIQPDPIITYEMDWWLVIAGIAAAVIVIGGIITFVPFKKKEKK